MIEKKMCTGCFACISICPQNCIEMRNHTDGFWYPSVDKARCIHCNKCIEVCPVGHKYLSKSIPIAFASYNKNKLIRMNSSSGGIFTLLSEKILEENGVVFGAAFDINLNVSHIAIDRKENLSLLRGSKYVQSKIGDAYKQAQEYILAGRKVLFSGTPCQIGGLKSFLNKDFENLICQDIICHGVPSPLVLRKYMNYNEIRRSDSIDNINFRIKENSWKVNEIRINFSKGSYLQEKAVKNCYMKLFVKNLSLRISCYSCQYRTLSRESDITLGDYWGIEKQHPEMDDDNGTSLILVHTEKGQKLFETIKNNIIYKKVDAENSVKFNSCAIKSTPNNPNRENFFSDLNNYDFDVIISKYCKDKKNTKVKRNIKAILKAILKVIKTILNKK